MDEIEESKGLKERLEEIDQKIKFFDENAVMLKDFKEIVEDTKHKSDKINGQGIGYA